MGEGKGEGARSHFAKREGSGCRERIGDRLGEHERDDRGREIWREDDGPSMALQRRC
jgi:hypothetical protein